MPVTAAVLVVFLSNNDIFLFVEGGTFVGKLEHVCSLLIIFFVFAKKKKARSISLSGGTPCREHYYLQTEHSIPIVSVVSKSTHGDQDMAIHFHLYFAATDRWRSIRFLLRLLQK